MTNPEVPIHLGRNPYHINIYALPFIKYTDDIVRWTKKHMEVAYVKNGQQTLQNARKFPSQI